ncbi:MAG: TRAP transporter small permease subunit [Rhodospirillaceae bacterium]
MNFVAQIYNKILFGMAALSGVVIFAAFLMIVTEVLSRFTPMPPLIWVLTSVEYILLWYTMLAAPYLVRIKGHVFVDAVTQFLPPKVKYVTAKIVYVLCIICCAIYCTQCWNLFSEAFATGELDTRSFEAPVWILLLPMPLCFGMCAIEFIRYLIGIDDMYSQDLLERENV